MENTVRFLRETGLLAELPKDHMLWEYKNE